MTAADFNLTALKSNVHTKSSGVSASGLLYVRGGGLTFPLKHHSIQIHQIVNSKSVSNNIVSLALLA